MYGQNHGPAFSGAQSIRLFKYWNAVIPATFSFIALVLVVLSIISGNSPGLMEDYHILYVSLCLSPALIRSPLTASSSTPPRSAKTSLITQIFGFA